MFIENNTPYVGKLRYRLERHPNYSGGNPWSKLNKVHVDLGFTKLVSRVYPNETMDGVEINKAKVREIEAFTGGKIGKYDWWDCVNKKTGKYHKLTKNPNPDIYEIRYHGELENSFLTKDGRYIGNIEDGWWYHRNQFTISEKYPGQVAIQYDEHSYKYKYLYYLTNRPAEEKILGCYGYSHRGGYLFKIGDRIFDEKYEPIVDDYEPWEWFGWAAEYEKALSDAKKRKDEFDIKDIQSDGISRYIPFAKRGKETIKTWQDAELAAYNLSKYLS